jgi:hypothetical protein
MLSAHPSSLPLEATIRRPVPRPGRVSRHLPLLAAVAVVYTLAQLVLVVPGMGLGWDETVYVSQVDPHTPAAFFSAPRARGITFLIAPVTALTTFPQVIHAYLAVLSGCALYLSLRVWRPLLPAPVLALAGVLFGGLWITLFYGSLVMPNLWVAYGTLIATGCFLRAVRDRDDLPALVGLGAGGAFVGLMRPGDAVWLVLPLGIAALTVRAWRRPAVLLMLVAAVILGGAEWVIEAYLRYGGLAARLHRASEIQGGMGWHSAFDDQMRALAGRTLCRPCAVRWEHPITAVWWFSLPLLTAGGLAAAARARHTAVVLVPTLTGLSLPARTARRAVSGAGCDSAEASAAPVGSRRCRPRAGGTSGDPVHRPPRRRLPQPRECRHHQADRRRSAPLRRPPTVRGQRGRRRTDRLPGGVCLGADQWARQQHHARRPRRNGGPRAGRGAGAWRPGRPTVRPRLARGADVAPSGTSRLSVALRSAVGSDGMPASP